MLGTVLDSSRILMTLFWPRLGSVRLCRLGVLIPLETEAEELYDFEYFTRVMSDCVLTKIRLGLFM